MQNHSEAADNAQEHPNSAKLVELSLKARWRRRREQSCSEQHGGALQSDKHQSQRVSGAIELVQDQEDTGSHVANE